MGYVNGLVHSTNEGVFISEFISRITSLDSRITCDTDIDELVQQMEDPSAEHKFDLRIGSNILIRFSRYSVYSGSYTISVETDDGNTTILSSAGIAMNDYTDDSAAVCPRTWKYNGIVTDKLILLYFGSYDNNMPNEYSFGIMYINDNGLEACASVNHSSGSIMNRDFYVNDGTIMNKLSALNYTYNAADVSKAEVIRQTTFLLLGTTIRKTAFDFIYDTSSLAIQRSPVFINGNKYYAVDAHTLIACGG